MGAPIHLVFRELREAYVSEWGLFAPGMVAPFVAAGLFLIQIGVGQSRLAFAAAAVIGLVVGVSRGMTIGVRHAGLESVSAFVIPAWEKVRLWAALCAVVCAVAMLARALVLMIKLRRRV